jgi:hypothetical protein
MQNKNGLMSEIIENAEGQPVCLHALRFFFADFKLFCSCAIFKLREGIWENIFFFSMK